MRGNVPHDTSVGAYLTMYLCCWSSGSGPSLPETLSSMCALPLSNTQMLFRLFPIAFSS